MRIFVHDDVRTYHERIDIEARKPEVSPPSFCCELGEIVEDVKIHVFVVIAWKEEAR